jgi:hypothetical protein
MFMNPDVRRKAIVLANLKASDDVVVHPRKQPAQHPDPPVFKALFLILDEMRNLLELQFPAGLPGRGARARKVCLPIDMLISVWHGSDGTVHLAVDVEQFIPYAELMALPRVP